MSFASTIANRAVLSATATRAQVKSSNRRSLIVKAEGEVAETEKPAAPAVRSFSLSLFSFKKNADRSVKTIVFFCRARTSNVMVHESASRRSFETSERCRCASIPTRKNSNRFFVLFFFDTQPEIRLISGEILEICFRFPRLYFDAFGRANGTNSCAEPHRMRWSPFEDEKMRASAREEKKIGNAIR